MSYASIARLVENQKQILCTAAESAASLITQRRNQCIEDFESADLCISELRDFVILVENQKNSLIERKAYLQQRMSDTDNNIEVRLTRIRQLDKELEFLKRADDLEFDMFFRSLTSSEVVSTVNSSPRITAKGDMNRLKHKILAELKKEMARQDAEERRVRKKLLASIY